MPGKDLDSAKLVRALARDFELMTPMIRWLNRAMGYRAIRAGD